MGRLAKFLNLAPADRACLLEAACWLGFARLAILVLPFRWLAPRLGKLMAQSPTETAAPTALLDRISWSVGAASRRLPWESTCLTMAMAGKAMLRRRGIASTLYLGVAREPTAGLHSHAWLRCGDRILTGEQTMSGFTIISTFAEE